MLAKHTGSGRCEQPPASGVEMISRIATAVRSGRGKCLHLPMITEAAQHPQALFRLFAAPSTLEYNSALASGEPLSPQIYPILLCLSRPRLAALHLAVRRCGKQPLGAGDAAIALRAPRPPAGGRLHLNPLDMADGTFSVDGRVDVRVAEAAGSPSPSSPSRAGCPSPHTSPQGQPPPSSGLR
jgi:hypothetical protein